MQRRRHLAGAAIVILACAFVAACSGDDDSSSDATTAARPTTTTLATAPASLREVLDRQKDAVIKITYQRGDNTFTIAQDHDKRAIRSGSYLAIFDGTDTVDCTGLDTTPTCQELGGDTNSIANIAVTFFDVLGRSLSTAADATPPIATTPEVVAGRPALCAEGDAATFLSDLTAIIGSVPSAQVRVCVDNATGYVLEYRNASDPSDDLVATRIETPAADEFKAPAKVEGATSD
jgi:hypothetical protein